MGCLVEFVNVKIEGEGGGDDFFLVVCNAI